MFLKDLIKYKGLVCVIKKTLLFPVHFVNNIIIKIKCNKLKNRVVSAELPSIEEVDNKKIEGFVLSLTSYPDRFQELFLTLKSILYQTIIPEKIIVYFGNDTKLEDLSDDLVKLEKYSIYYKFDDSRNLMPHKKYYYAMQEYKDKCIITIDDDIIFPSTAIEELVVAYKKHPDCVCARRVHKIIIKNNRINPYKYWELDYKKTKEPRHDLLATTGAGVLYPPRLFDNNTFDENAIIELCLKADDIWLKCMEILNDKKVFYCHNKIMGTFIKENDEKGLMVENVLNNKNDVCLNNVMKRYNLTAGDFN